MTWRTLGRAIMGAVIAGVVVWYAYDLRVTLQTMAFNTLISARIQDRLLVDYCMRLGSVDARNSAACALLKRPAQTTQ